MMECWSDGPWRVADEERRTKPPRCSSAARPGSQVLEVVCRPLLRMASTYQTARCADRLKSQVTVKIISESVALEASQGPSPRPGETNVTPATSVRQAQKSP
jgi:hypothetical protein